MRTSWREIWGLVVVAGVVGMGIGYLAATEPSAVSAADPCAWSVPSYGAEQEIKKLRQTIEQQAFEQFMQSETLRLQLQDLNRRMFWDQYYQR